MKINITQKPRSTIEIDLVCTEAETQHYLALALDQLRKTAKISGFRQGKADDATLYKHFGETRIKSEMLDTALPKIYFQVVKEKNLQPISQAKTSIIDDSPLHVKFEVPVMPEVVLGDYQKIKIKTDSHTVTDKEIDEVIHEIAANFGEHIEITDRACQDGEHVEINFTGEMDGKKMDSLASKNQPLVLGQKYFIPGFEEKIIGMKPGETKDITVKFPTDYHSKQFAGKEAKFQVELLKIHENIPAPIDDKLAEKASKGHIKTLTKLREDISQTISDRNIRLAKQEQENKVLTELAKITKVDIPPAMLNDELDYLEHAFTDNLKSRKIDFADFLKSKDTTREKLREGWQKEAHKRIVVRLALLEIAKKDNIEIATHEIDQAEIERLAKNQEDHKRLQVFATAQKKMEKALAQLVTSSSK